MVDESKNPLAEYGLPFCDNDDQCKGKRFCGVGGICHGDARCTAEEIEEDKKMHIDPLFNDQYTIADKITKLQAKALLKDISRKLKLLHEKLWKAVSEAASQGHVFDHK